MNRIFKYELQAEGRQLINMPEGAQLLSVINQHELPVLYALVDESQPAEQRIFRLVTTGENFNAAGSVFIGTVVLRGWFVGHLFEQLQQGQSDVRSDRFAEDFRELRLPEPEVALA